MKLKRIEAIILEDKVEAVSGALNNIVEGFTVIEGNGRGYGARQTIRIKRGTDTIVAKYNKVAIIITVVDDSEVEKVSTTIADIAFTGEGGDGIIIVTSVDSMMNTTSKKGHAKLWGK